MIDQVLQIGIVGAAAAAENLHAELTIEAQHILTPVLQIIPVQHLGAIELAMIE